MRKITILLAFLFFVGANFANAQTRTISGKVTGSSDGAGIPGVTVQVQGRANSHFFLKITLINNHLYQ